MKIYFFLFLIVFVFSCQNRTESKNVVQNDENPNNNKIIKVDEKTDIDDKTINTTTIKCGDKDFNLLVSDKNGSKSVNIIEGNATKKTINLPNQSDVNGFSLNWARETKEGFEISIEYGSRFYYDKNFSFVCKEEKFYLAEIKINTFDKHDPENFGKEYVKEVKPNLPLDQFLINKFIGND